MCHKLNKIVLYSLLSFSFILIETTNVHASKKEGRTNNEPLVLYTLQNTFTTHEDLERVRTDESSGSQSDGCGCN